MKFKDILLNNKFKIYFSVLLFILSFIITRLPFFYYFKVPLLGADTTDYIDIMRMLSGKNVAEIGFPGVGYPLFLKFCFWINNKLIFVTLVQTLLQYLSVFLFLLIYNKYVKRYYYWVLILMIGYLSSSFNQFYDVFLYPDSLISTCFILFTSIFLLLFNVRGKKSELYFFILSLILAYAISIRANGILLLPLVFLYLIWMYIQNKNIKEILKKILILLIPLLLLSTFNYFSPIYKVFAPFSSPKVPIEKPEEYKNETETDSSWFYLTQIVPEGYFYKNFKKELFNDESSRIYVNSYSRGYRVHYENLDSIIIYNYSDEKWNYPSFNLNKYVDSTNLKSSQKKKLLIKFKKYLKKTNKQAIKIIFANSLYVRNLLFISFFKFYYVNDFKSAFTKENAFFYEDNVKNNFWMLVEMNELVKPFGDLSIDFFKEFYNTKFLYDKEFIDGYKTNLHWKFKSSIYYRYFVKPFYIIHNLIFRNILFPLLFLIIYLLSFYKLFTKNSGSQFFYLFGVGSLLILTNILHSYKLVFLISRYTYQVSFIYFIFVGFIPLILIKFKNVKQ